MEKMSEKGGKKGKKNEEKEEPAGRRTNQSAKVFAALNEIAKTDRSNKEAKRANKEAGKGYLANRDIALRPSSDSAKRHKL